ncbi:MAG: PRC-barrel domain-containing protein [Alphaproteobacteria bacterium]|nr:PRC-barrel domain-containing protein [Alphaproteobacteria bacterium]
MKQIFFLLVGAFCFSFTVLSGCYQAKAEEPTAAKIMGLQKTISEYNRIKPLQNPRYEESSEILKRRVIDSRNKVIGEVQDVLFDRYGRVTSLYVEFDRLNLGQSVYLNHDILDVKSVTTGYRLGFNDDEIKTLYPALLSGIETASGTTKDNEQNRFSLKDILDTDVINSDGIIIGNLQDILFDNNGAYVRSVYLNINHRSVHNEGIAVPISILKFIEKGGKSYVVIDNAYVDSILEMAKKG